MRNRKIKSAYELGCERIIASDYKVDKNKESSEENDNILPENIDDWSDFLYGDKISIDFIDDKTKPNMGFSESLLDNKKKQIKPKDNVKKNSKGEIMVKNKETVNYSSDLMGVHWYGNFTSYSGFSRLNRAMAFGLSNRNVKVKADMQNTSVDVNESTLREIERLSRNDVDSDAPKVFSATVPLNMFHGGKKISYTMIETSETMHKDYVGKLNLFDEIWVPTDYSKKMFKNNGVSPHIEVMPLGVDTERYNDNVNPMKLNMRLKSFVFISVFKWGYRKGYDILLKSFMEEFNSSDDVSLLIVSRTDVHHKPEIIINDFNNVKQTIMKDEKDLPHISLYDKPIKEKDMPRIYKAGNAFVLISRGEGFCLPIYEASACGLPIISSNCSGQKELLERGGAFTVDPEGYSKASINGNMSKLAKHCGFYDGQIFPEFGRESIDQVKSHMRSVYENYEEAKKYSKKLTTIVHNDFSWDNAVDKVYNRLCELI